jgi:hypothetical protein
VDTLFLSGPSFLLENLDAPTRRRTQEGVRQLLADRLPGRIAASGALLGLLVIAVWRAGLAESAVLGMVSIFALSAPSAYYWVMLLAMPLRPGTWAPLAVLLLAAASYWTQSVYPYQEYEPWRYALLAWGYAAIFVAWLLPDLVRALNRHRAAEDRAGES